MTMHGGRPVPNGAFGASVAAPVYEQNVMGHLSGPGVTTMHVNAGPGQAAGTWEMSGEVRAEVCNTPDCHNHYQPDSNYCRKCGVIRPSMQQKHFAPDKMAVYSAPPPVAYSAPPPAVYAAPPAVYAAPPAVYAAPPAVTTVVKQQRHVEIEHPEIQVVEKIVEVPQVV